MQPEELHFSEAAASAHASQTNHAGTAETCRTPQLLTTFYPDKGGPITRALMTQPAPHSLVTVAPCLPWPASFSCLMTDAHSSPWPGCAAQPRSTQREPKRLQSRATSNILKREKTAWKPEEHSHLTGGFSEASDWLVMAE